MSIFLIFILYICSLMMFFVKREQKISLLAIYLICLQSVSSSVFPATITPVFTFVLSEIRHSKQYVSLLKESKLLWPLLILIISVIVLYFNSPHLTGIGGVWTALNNTILRNYIVLFIVFVTATNISSLRPLSNVCFISLCILTVFGIINLITKHAIFVDWVVEAQTGDSFITGSYYTDSERFRVQAMFVNPFNYGYVCFVLLLFFEYLRRKKEIGSIKYFIALFCCLFGIITCGARTLLAVSIISLFVYLIFGFKIKRQLLIIPILFLSVFIIILFVPEVSDRLAFMATAFSDNSDISGSSLTMRQYQLAAVMYHIKDDLLFGRGFGFFVIDMGWSQGPSGLVDKDLFGIEGVYLAYLLERGIFGFCLYVIYWLLIIKIVIRSFKNTRDKVSFGVNMAVIAAYLCFANMTGELLSVPITNLMLGLTLGIQMRDIINKHAITKLKV